MRSGADLILDSAEFTCAEVERMLARQRRRKAAPKLSLAKAMLGRLRHAKRETLALL